MSERADLSAVRAVLCDLDGVLYVGKEPIAGAAEAITELKARGIPMRFLTNTTTRSRVALHEKLRGLHLPIEVDEIFSALNACARYVRDRNATCRLVLSEPAKAEFDGVGIDDDDPDVIVIGDIGDHWTFLLMNELFNLVINGAELIACHRGRYFQAREGLRLDIGAFVAGLEYSAGTTATVIGKPSPTFFSLALDDLGVEAESAVMVGDDIETDVGGGQTAGLRGVLVQTGKYRARAAGKSEVTPDATIASIADLPRLLR